MSYPTIGAQASRLAQDLSLNGESWTTTPKLVYGTAWKEARTADLVYKALVKGFRGIDTAAQPKHYNEKGVSEGVARAIKDRIVTRQDLFIQTKYTSPDGHSEICPYDLDAPLVDQVKQSIQSSLNNFTFDDGQAPYLDSLVLHSPMATMEDTFTVWKTFETFHPHQVRNLGISNTTLPILQALVETMNVMPSIVQNRFWDKAAHDIELRKYCRDHEIIYQSFWTLTSNSRLIRSEPVRDVARAVGISNESAFYCLVLALEGLTILDGTTSESHMQEDLESIEKVGAWAEGAGIYEWTSALVKFKESIGDSID